MTLTQTIAHGFAAYVVTTVVTQAHVLKWFRMGFRWCMGFFPFGNHFARFYTNGKPVVVDDADIPDDAPQAFGYDFITCPLCLGFWVSLALTLPESQRVLDVLAVYGVAYLLTKLERQY